MTADGIGCHIECRGVILIVSSRLRMPPRNLSKRFNAYPAKAAVSRTSPEIATSRARHTTASLLLIHTADTGMYCNDNSYTYLHFSTP
ncbi:hypothetical protein GJ744_010994 [Endocarpon pusillum]|uniref:Uncharacterized protein n=1 Tax=Endocarpon pusillum TaxID=364733 RepID=A0A8H7AHA9_9EURO|nr:hypothetical protein GJ744_010994 [Endocarpon pusillum]